MGKRASVSRCSAGQRGNYLVSKGVNEGFLEEVIIGLCFIEPVGACLGNSGGGRKGWGEYFRQRKLCKAVCG